MKSLKIFALILSVSAAVSMLSACNYISAAADENNYVNTLSERFEEIVKKNRELNKIRNSWTLADTQSTNDYLESIDTLLNLYLNLRNINPTEKYSVEDYNIDIQCQDQITALSQEKALVQYALDAKDDSAYQSGIEDILFTYTSAYDSIDNSMANIKTDFRNG
ncbi:MAG: hypothetical protein ACI4M3_00195 [Acutalibacteraceae bacterium]